MMEGKSSLENKSELAVRNGLMMACYSALSLVMSLAYLIEAAKGNRTFLYALVVCAAALLPAAANLIIFLRNNESAAARIVPAVGFMAVYVFVLFTTSNMLVFTYAIPMLIVAAVYTDMAFSIKFSLGVMLANICQIGLFYGRGMLVGESAVMAEIQVLVMAVVCVFTVLTTSAILILNRRKVEEATSGREKAEKVFRSVMEVAEAVADGVEAMSGRVKELDESAAATQLAMEDVNSGAGETADAMQQQLKSSENIQRHIGNVKGASEGIAHEMRQAYKAVQSGKTSIDGLNDNISATEEANGRAAKELESLEEFMSRMKSIIDLIENITSQTSLLALNASIEAARAGDAGKGFAVVASEITSLANQTQEATVNIAEAIENFSDELSGAISTINVLIENIREQGEAAKSVMANFENIARRTDNVQGRVASLTEAVGELSGANAEIVSTVQTVSAVSEETSARSNETLEIAGRNREIVEDMSGIVEGLSGKANELNGLRQ